MATPSDSAALSAPFHFQLSEADAALLLPTPPSPLICSFPPSLHPLHDTVRSICDPWILRLVDHVHPLSASQRQFLLDCLLPRYACRLFAASPLLPRLCAATKLIAWFTLADDFADESDAAVDSEAAHVWSHSVISVLEGKYPLPQNGSGRAGVLLEALAEVWGEISTDMPNYSKERFVRAACEHFGAVIQQSALRTSSSVTTVAEFMAVRRPASGFPMGMELLPYVLCMGQNLLELPDHPLLAELRSLVVDYMCVCNDLLSFGVEMAKGDHFNLPCVLYAAGEVATLQEAVDKATQMAEGLDARCVEVVRQINVDVTGELATLDWEAYVATLVACMAGTVRWSYESARYDRRRLLRQDPSS